jgi:hypothetical protein
MIKFFRKIRQRLLSENKFSKYFLYAIGEISLVVIGILIALQVNNWNEQKKLNIQEVKMLKEFRIDLTQALDDLEGNITDLQSCIKSNEIILNQITKKLSYNDSLDYHFAMLYPYIIFSANQTTYENAKQTGFHLISNDSLKTTISNLYGNLFKTYIESENNYLIKHFDNHLKPMFISEFTTFEYGTSMHPKNYSNFIENTEHQQIINFTIDACKNFIGVQTYLKSQVMSILELIDKEIEG